MKSRVPVLEEELVGHSQDGFISYEDEAENILHSDGENADDEGETYSNEDEDTDAEGNGNRASRLTEAEEACRAKLVRMLEEHDAECQLTDNQCYNLHFVVLDSCSELPFKLLPALLLCYDAETDDEDEIHNHDDSNNNVINVHV